MASARALKKFCDQVSTNVVGDLADLYIKQYILSSTFGVPDCGCTIEEVDPYEVRIANEKGYERRKDVADGTYFWVKYTPMLERYAPIPTVPGFSDPSVVFTTDEDAVNLFCHKEEFSDESLFTQAMEQFACKGLSMECLKVLDDDDTGYAIIKLTGAGWLGKLNNPLVDDYRYVPDYYSDIDESEDITPFNWPHAHMSLQFIDVSVEHPTLCEPQGTGYFEDRDCITDSAVWLPASNQYVLIRVSPKEGALHSNKDLLCNLGAYVKQGHAQKASRDFVDRITKDLPEATKDAIVAIKESSGNIQGAKQTASDRVEELTKELATAIGVKAFLDLGDYSSIEAAALSAVAECAKVISSNKFDDGIKRLAKSILTMN